MKLKLFLVDIRSYTRLVMDPRRMINVNATTGNSSDIIDVLKRTHFPSFKGTPNITQKA